jgi:hypothetical protein
MNKYVVFIGIGFELIGLILVAVYLSEYLEKIHPSKGIITAGLVLLALVGWFVHILILLRRPK